MQTADRHIEDLKTNSETCERSRGKLQDSVLVYKHRSDTLQMVLDQYEKVVEEVAAKIVQDSVTHTQIIEELEDSLERYFERVTHDSLAKEEEFADNLRKISRLEENLQALKAECARSSEQAKLYRATSDSLQRNLQSFYTDFRSYQKSASSDSLETERKKKNLERRLAELEGERARADSLEALMNQGSETLNDLLETAEEQGSSESGGNWQKWVSKGKNFLNEHGDAIGATGGTLLAVAAVAAIKADHRYAIEEEFALLWACLYEGANNRSVTKAEYEQLADCCADALAEIEKQYPSYKKFTKSGSGNPSCGY